MYINRIYEVGPYFFNLCAKGDGKVKLGVQSADWRITIQKSFFRGLLMEFLKKPLDFR